MGGGEVARYLGTYGDDRINKAVLASAVTPALFKSDDNPDGGLDDPTVEFLKNAYVPIGSPSSMGSCATSSRRALERTSSATPSAPTCSASPRSASPKATLDCIDAWGRTDFRADLASVKVPTLVIHGDADAVVPFEVSGRRAHEAVAGSELLVFDGAPHGLTVTHADRFNNELLSFLGR